MTYSPQPDIQNTTPNNTDYQSPLDDKGFFYTVILVILWVFGGFTFLASLFYVQDIQTLRNAPDLVWSFICGQPIDSDITLPLLLTISLVTFLISGIVYIWKRFVVR